MLIDMSRADNAEGNTIFPKGRYILETRPVFRLVPNRYLPINVSGYRGQKTRKKDRRKTNKTRKFCREKDRRKIK